jgi:hypothetical protein
VIGCTATVRPRSRGTPRGRVRGHAAAVTGLDPVDTTGLAAVRDRLVAKLENQAADRKALLGEYARANGTAERAVAERILRDSMSPEQAAEEHARVRHARTRRRRDNDLSHRRRRIRAGKVAPRFRGRHAAM